MIIRIRDKLILTGLLRLLPPWSCLHLFLYSQVWLPEENKKSNKYIKPSSFHPQKTCSKKTWLLKNTSIILTGKLATPTSTSPYPSRSLYSRTSKSKTKYKNSAEMFKSQILLFFKTTRNMLAMQYYII